MIPRLALAALALFLPYAAWGENWPGFRGPTGQGISAESHLPITWSGTENVAWQTPIPGVGWSSPIVWGDKVFVTSATDNGQSCHVICVDAGSGKVLWDRQVFRQTPGRKEQQNSYATPTAVTDGQHVYAVFSAGGVAAVDMNGEVTWTNQDMHFYSKHGLGASPILYNDLLIMPFDGSSSGENDKVGWLIPWDGAVIIAYDKATGKERWRAKRGLSRQAHVTPRVMEVDGKPQLISPAGNVIEGFDPSDGKLIWMIQSRGEGVVPTFVAGEGLLFTSSGFEAETIRAVKPGGQGDVTATNVVWESRKTVPLIPSMLYADGLLFGVKENGIGFCLDAKTGQTVWQHRMEAKYWASPVWAEGRLYFLAENGTTTVIEAGREYKQVARNELEVEGPCQASPAISGGRIFIRSKDKLLCIAGAK